MDNLHVKEESNEKDYCDNDRVFNLRSHKAHNGASPTSSGDDPPEPHHLSVVTPPFLLDTPYQIINPILNNYAATYNLRQLNKIKRFLCTLVQFGADISPDVGDRVRTLVLSVVSATITVEEFHQSLQDVTNFPLRPFVLPFLKNHLPGLQREVYNLARTTKQSTFQYIRSHDYLILDPTFSPSEASEIFVESENKSDGGGTDVSVNGHSSGPATGKRRITELSTENSPTYQTNQQNAGAINTSETTETGPPSKRFNTSNQFLNASNSMFSMPTLSQNHTQSTESYGSLGPTTQIPQSHLNQIGQLNAVTHAGQFSQFHNNHKDPEKPPDAQDPRVFLTGDSEEWKNIHVMLNCILSMVEKTKRALTILQQRNTSQQDQMFDWFRRQEYGGFDFKKVANDILVAAIRQTEDRVAEIKRKAEEAVNEVKKQAINELHKVIQLAESRANELITHERVKFEKILDKKCDETQLVPEGAERQSPTGAGPVPVTATATTTVTTPQRTPNVNQNVCWNCGRKANETCSGCNLARYCGSFCQHKDWENHHTVCGQTSGQTHKRHGDAAKFPKTIANNLSPLPGKMRDESGK